MSSPQDRDIDAELRKVPLPEDLLARLKQIASFSDSELDLELRAVTVPDGLTERLLGISRYSDEELDFLLRDVPVEPHLPVQLARVVNERQSRVAWGHWAMAASLFLAVSIALLGTAGGFWMSSYYARQHEKSEPAPLGNNVEVALDGPGPLRPESPLEDPAAWPDAKVPAPAESLAGSTPDAPPSEVGELMNSLDKRDSMRDAAIARHPNLFASQGGFDEIKELALVSPLTARGVVATPVWQYDHLFAQRNRAHPFVNPESHPSLATSRVPLVSDTASYDLLARMIRSGELPPREAIRVEEILAAMEYELPRPTDQPLGIRTAAGPSVFSGSGLHLLQVAVQTKALARDPGASTYLTIGIDASGSMRSQGRLDMTQRALSALARQLGPRDRLALVVFREQAEVLIEDAGPNDLQNILTAVASLDARGSTNLGAGVQLASAVALRAPVEAGRKRSLVVLTDGLAELDGRTIQSVKLLAAETLAEGVPLHVIDLGYNGPTESQLSAFAEAGGGWTRRGDTSHNIRSAFLEALAGQGQLVAVNATLDVKFNPQAVSQYRLLGHEAQAGGGLLAGTPESNLKAEESATALYEVALKPNAIDDVAVATVSWRDPVTSEQRQLTQRISRLQFSNSLAGSPLSLQVAALAAEAAQILRQSSFAPANSHSFDRILATSARANPRLRRNPALAELLSLVDQAQRAKPADNQGE